MRGATTTFAVVEGHGDVPGQGAGEMTALLTLPRSRFRCILADVPSRFVAGTKGRPQHYKRMREDELVAMPIGELAHPDGCWLFFWATSPHACTFWRVPEAWGFRFSMGYTTRKNACWLFRKGTPKRNARDVHEVMIAQVRKHSHKPDEQYERIERFCSGPRLELFARSRRRGWISWGDEVGKFTKQPLPGP